MCLNRPLTARSLYLHESGATSTPAPLFALTRQGGGGVVKLWAVACCGGAAAPLFLRKSSSSQVSFPLCSFLLALLVALLTARWDTLSEARDFWAASPASLCAALPTRARCARLADTRVYKSPRVRESLREDVASSSEAYMSTVAQQRVRCMSLLGSNAATSSTHILAHTHVLARMQRCHVGVEVDSSMSSTAVCGTR